MHTRPDERLVVARHGHGDEAHGDRAGFGWEGRVSRGFLSRVSGGGSRGQGGWRTRTGRGVVLAGSPARKFSLEWEGGERTFFCHGEGCGEGFEAWMVMFVMESEFGDWEILGHVIWIRFKGLISKVSM